MERAIIFDFGGVLFEWDPRYLYRKLFNRNPQAMERFLAEIDFWEWNLQQDKGRPFAEAVAVLSRQFPHYADQIQAYDQRWEESIVGPIQPTVDIVWSLKQAGHRLYALSNWSAEKFRLFRPRHELFKWFDDILVSGEVKCIKPDHRIYTLFLERIGQTAEECVFIDDSEPNIVAAQQLGFITIRYESPEQLNSALNTMGLL
ncbi:MAG: hypothetical protein A2Z16_02850 [Chloroflexi bacterium RBG_16_54_18]|nr:MAG: hypothetical protein A2Z16_02850 [Chloroflexi bacterium RBG_16_54_18]